MLTVCLKTIFENSFLFLKNEIFFLKLEIFLQFFDRKQHFENLFFEEHILIIFSCFLRTMLKNNNTDMETNI